MHIDVASANTLELVTCAGATGKSRKMGSLLSLFGGTHTRGGGARAPASRTALAAPLALNEV